MKVKTLSALAGIGSAMILTGSADAAFVGLETVLVASNQATSLGARDVYRVYAVFDNAGDRVNAWYGNAANPLSIQNVLADGVTLGAGFTQFGGVGGQIAPYSPGARDWDTYATIGVRYGNQAPGGADATSLSPGFPTFITGNSLSGNNLAVFITPDMAQGAAGYAAADGGPANAVMLMQLTVNVGEHVRGTISVDGQVAGGAVFSATSQNFASVIIPAPGALALLGIAGLVGRRRRA